ncbi:hypothetical protein [Tepidibacter hydrothermalis]|uniref:Uncharacterized protein n=1 Tax=Tepidibacter hydrothermalis TaxID=3036126 RepID=A0ABY8EHK2_9FIRM|nr:hypothetical protein [Tepidibacter hydrothermalis]WFD12428.1 hypothetical protein P4S50_20045 [Tepidibacter hydrothermalis]
MRIDGLYKEYKVKKEKILLCLVIFSIISLIIVGHIISIGIELNNVSGTYSNTKNISQSSEIDVNNYINQTSYDMQSKNYKEEISLFVFLFLAAAAIYHIYFFTKTKLIMNNKGIELYSIYSKKPCNTLYWNEIKSIQIGYILANGNRISRYGIKIRHIKKSHSQHEQLKEFVPIIRFKNYSNLIKDLEEIAEELNIDIYHMDD